MYRDAYEDLKNWQKAPNRKPLIIKGARQVGKTWLVKHFGEECYQNMIYINFDHDASAKDIFALDYDVSRIITRLSLHARQDIAPASTLIFLDEIQECPEALESIKYFAEDAPEYHVIAAGSLLGLYLHEGASFPVGKVEFLDIHPLNFSEFLIVLGEERLAAAIAAKDYDLIAPFHDKLIEYYKTYLVTGGMPEVVQDYIVTKSLLNTRKIQENIVESYNRDFSKHAPASEVPRIIDIFSTIPNVLAKENKKFMFGAIRPSARAREYEKALLWLLNANLVSKVIRVNKLALPLSAYGDNNIFKLFYVDVGLLGYKAGIRPETIIEDDPFMEEYKGALAEQFVFEEFISHGVTPFYYSKDDSRAELDFVIDTTSGPTPIEVKSGRALASKSFKSIMDNNPKIKRSFKMSFLSYKDNGRIINLPIYLAGTLG